MAAQPTLSDILVKFQAQEASIERRISELESELAELHEELKEKRIVRSALEAQIGEPSEAPAKSTSSKSSASAGAKSKTAASKATGTGSGTKPAAKKAEANATSAPKTAASSGRKGRRKPGRGSQVHDLGIVDAALQLAREKNVEKADAGEILEWFQEAGYKTRNGTPTRNSIYVSLNREFTEGKKKGAPKVTRPGRGVFVFHFENA